MVPREATTTEEEEERPSGRDQNTTGRSLTILYCGERVHRFAGDAAVAAAVDRSSYLRSVAERWSQRGGGGSTGFSTHDIVEPLPLVGPGAVRAVLRALDGGGLIEEEEEAEPVAAAEEEEGKPPAPSSSS